MEFLLVRHVICAFLMLSYSPLVVELTTGQYKTTDVMLKWFARRFVFVKCKFDFHFALLEENVVDVITKLPGELLQT